MPQLPLIITHNIENIDKLIAFLQREGEEHFDMNTWFDVQTPRMRAAALTKTKGTNDTPACGTIMCMGGACSFLMMPASASYAVMIEQPVKWREIAHWLGISEQAAVHLFFMAYPETSNSDGVVDLGDTYGVLKRVTLQEALKALAYVRETGGFDFFAWKEIAPHVIYLDQLDK